MLSELTALGRDAELEADLAIVGAGAAGIALASELLGSGLQICLLESGGDAVKEASQALADGVCVGHPLVFRDGCFRAFGGSTTRWTGRCARLDREDFLARPWLPHSGWPIAYEDVAPYYSRAERVCGFDDPWTDDARALAIGAPLPPPPLDPAIIASYVWRYPPHRRAAALDFGRRFRSTLRAAASVKAVLDATLTGFEVSSSGERVTAVRVRSLDGGSARVKARAYVLACGGIANARALLEGARTTGAAFGGRQVGRFFQQHSRGVVATVETDEAGSARLQRMFNIFRPVAGADHEIGLALPHEAQKAEGLLNASAILTYEEDPESGWQSAKALWRSLRAGQVHPQLLRKLENVAGDADRVTENMLRSAAGRTIVRTRRIEALVDLEQAPDPESRITLADERDAFGLPLPRVDWRLSELERRTSLRFAEHIKTEMERLGLGRVTLASWLTSSEPMPLRETYHHIGATRMSETPADGVVDRHCKVHGMDNLYVAGSSVFPTGGHANPTFTIVALALRLADHLRARLKRLA